MSGVKEYLRRRRKAELQTIHQFWYPGESRLTTREALERRLVSALSSGQQLSEKLARLTKTQLELLRSLLEQRPNFSAPSAGVLRRLESAGNPRLEVESAARMLLERGFIERLRRRDVGRNVETYHIPTELAGHLEQALDLRGGKVAAEHQLSQRRLPFEIDFEGETLQDRIGSLCDPDLQELVGLALESRGVADMGVSRLQEIISRSGGGADLCRREWVEQLERAGIGTIGPISLRDFGILIEEPAVIIFQEWMKRYYAGALKGVAEPDTVVESGVDLYIDIDRLAGVIDLEPAKLTRDGRVPKRLREAMRGAMHLHRIEGHLEGDMTDAVLKLALRLGIIESYAGTIRVDRERLRVWRKLDLLRQVEVILDRFVGESRGSRWSFHQEFLRSIVLDLLKEHRPAGWVSFDALVGLSVSTYMLELEVREVRETLRHRREEDFSRERLNTPFHRLGSDLTYWLVNRFLPNGMCELGLDGGRLTAFRLTPLGKEVLGIPCEQAESRLLVNPNFEIMLICEGLRGMRLELALSRFGERVSAERVRRYRVSRESVREGIRAGLSSAEIRRVLDEGSDHAIPDPVLVAIDDWGKDLDWIQVEQAVLLRGVRPDKAREVMELLAEEELQSIPCEDGSVAILFGSESPAEVTSSLLEVLRERGWLVRESPPEPLRLESSQRKVL